MNKTLTALMTKLTWQLSELDQQIQTIENELGNLEQQLQENKTLIANASITPSIILPEQEIGRLNYMMRQQQLQDDINQTINELSSQKNALSERKIRVNMELKMLTKHQQNQHDERKHQLDIQQQNAADEWVTQRREPV